MLLASYGSTGGGGPFTPASLPGLAGWWDASDAATITLSSGKVSLWDDKSGAGRHAAQTDSTLRATMGTLNGLGCLIGAASRMFFSDLTLANDSYYLFVVASVATGGNSILIGNTSDGSYGLWLQGVTIYSQLGGAESSMSASPAGQPHVLGRHSTAVGNWMHCDAVATAKPQRGGVMNGFGNYSGGLYLNGPLAEVIVGTGQLTDAQVLTTKAYLKAKWGTP